MGDGGLRYDRMVESALRGVMRDALHHVLRHGLPGAHHFYLSFRTDHPGVDIDASLRQRFPEEMTIVLQHQFWDLKIGEEEFSVTLSFSNQPQKLVVPFAAVTTFTDPSVNFQLQFQPMGDKAANEKGAPAHATATNGSTKPAAGAKAAKTGSVTPLPKPAAPVPAPDQGEKVVTLDSFRKK